MPDVSPILGLPIAKGSDPVKQYPAAVDSPRTLALETFTVPRFPTAAARDTAIPAPTAGMMCYLADTGTSQRHNGYVWVGDTAPTTLTFMTGWTNYAGSGVKMSADGVVVLSLAATAASGGTQICTIPANYRPKGPADIYGPVLAQPGYIAGRLQVVAATGAVNVATSVAANTVTAAFANLTWQANFLAVR